MTFHSSCPLWAALVLAACLPSCAVPLRSPTTPWSSPPQSQSKSPSEPASIAFSPGAGPLTVGPTPDPSEGVRLGATPFYEFTKHDVDEQTLTLPDLEIGPRVKTRVDHRRFGVALGAKISPWIAIEGLIGAASLIGSANDLGDESPNVFGGGRLTAKLLRVGHITLGAQLAVTANQAQIEYVVLNQSFDIDLKWIQYDARLGAAGHIALGSDVALSPYLGTGVRVVDGVEQITGITSEPEFDAAEAYGLLGLSLTYRDAEAKALSMQAEVMLGEVQGGFLGVALSF